MAVVELQCSQDPEDPEDPAFLIAARFLPAAGAQVSLPVESVSSALVIASPELWPVAQAPS